MTLEDTLLEIEHELAAGSGDAYRRRLADDARVIVPGQALTKDETVAAMDDSPGWDEVAIEDVRLLALGDDGAVLTYRFAGSRGTDFHYAALMSSAYARTPDGWKLRLHQQTPLPTDG